MQCSLSNFQDISNTNFQGKTILIVIKIIILFEIIKKRRILLNIK